MEDHCGEPAKTPTTLEECFQEIRKLFGACILEDMKNEPEDRMVKYHHHNLGQWMRNNWNLWEGTNDLCLFFHSVGIYHPDDMSTIILRSFHRHLNEKLIDVEDQADTCLMHWASLDIDQKVEWEKRNAKKKID